MDEHISVEIAEGVLTIRIDRPERSNAFTSEMFEAFVEGIDVAERDGAVRAVVISGTHGLFTTGHEPENLRAYAESGVFGDGPVRLMKTLATADKPLVAAVDGLTFGLGTTMLLHCDMVVASEWSVFSAPFTALGLPPEGGASLLAPGIMGYHRAFELMVLGEQFDAQQALAAGLINRVVPPEDVTRVALDCARALARQPSQAVRMVRRMLRGERRDVVVRINQEAKAFSELLQSPAAHEALITYVDRNRR